MAKKRLLSTAVAATLAFGFVASADAVTFYTRGFGGFVDESWSVDPFPDPAGEVGNFVNEGDAIWHGISWGTGQGDEGPFGGKSGAIINLAQEGEDYVVARQQDVPPVGATAFELLGALTHINQPIDEWWQGDDDAGIDFDSSDGIDAGKAEVKVRYVFELYDNAADRDAANVANAIYTLNSKDFGDFTVFFQETHNDGDCPPPNPNGTDCDDIFEFGPVDIMDSFVYEGERFGVEIAGFFDGPDFDNLTGKLYTGEGMDSTGYVAELKFVPEPASLVLLGVGLAGIGAMRRRAPKA